MEHTGQSTHLRLPRGGAFRLCMCATPSPTQFCINTLYDQFPCKNTHSRAFAGRQNYVKEKKVVEIGLQFSYTSEKVLSFLSL